MAGETTKSEAICLDIRPWSRTSHVVTWLTPAGRIVTSVKGAERPKSPFLGQYDLNYSCEIVYYLRSRGDIHALRECVPSVSRDWLRGDFRAAALAGYYRRLAADFAPQGPDCRAWFDLLARALDASSALTTPDARLRSMLGFDLAVLDLMGLRPDFTWRAGDAQFAEFSVAQACFKSPSDGDFGRFCRVSRETAACLANPADTEKNPLIPLDAARVISVFYSFHLDCPLDVRRSVLGMIS